LLKLDSEIVEFIITEVLGVVVPFSGVGETKLIKGAWLISKVTELE
jgi:hypothetical protein